MAKRLPFLIGLFFGFVFVFGDLPGPLRAQDQAQEELVPLTCWWRTDKSAVRFAEPFRLFLTCRVAETDSDAIVLNESALDPSVMSLPPFNVFGGKRYADVRHGYYRFFYYSYDVEFMEGGFFGKEVQLPSLELSYHLETRTSRGQTVTAQERIYKLPELKMRIHSLVREDAEDIRDPSGILPGEAETFRFRANVAFMAGLFFLLVAVVMVSRLGFAGVRDWSRKKEDAGVSPFGDFAMAGRMTRELKKIRKTASRTGWSPELIARTTAVLRIVGAVLISGNIKQVSVGLGEKELQGQIRLRKWTSPFKKILVSSGVTAGAVRDRLVRNGLMTKRNEEFAAIFDRFSRARNGYDLREANFFKSESYDESLLAALRFIRWLRFLNFWPVKKYLNALQTARKAVRAWRA